MKTAVIIPARMAATRFPGKPLAPIAGLPMIEHVRRRSALSRYADEVWVATCDRAIKEAVEAHGGKAVMTADTHERCTERIAEANATIKADIVINVQGDEPLVHPDLIDQLILGLKDADESVSSINFISPIKLQAELESANVVKTVIDRSGNALYFSRFPIPHTKTVDLSIQRWKQLGLMAFRGSFLDRYLNLSSTPLEIAESCDMLRALEHGFAIKTLVTDVVTVGVDIPADVSRVETLLRSDPLVARYS